MDAPLKLLHLKTNDVLFALDLINIYKIIYLCQLTYLPLRQPFVTGLLNLNGESILVIDLCTLLGMKRHYNYSINNSIIICELNDAKLGLIVDEVYGVVDADENSLQSVSKEKKFADFILGMYMIDNEIAYLLNIKTIFNVDKNEVIEKRNAQYT